METLADERSGEAPKQFFRTAGVGVEVFEDKQDPHAILLRNGQ